MNKAKHFDKKASTYVVEHINGGGILFRKGRNFKKTPPSFYEMPPSLYNSNVLYKGLRYDSQIYKIELSLHKFCL